MSKKKKKTNKQVAKKPPVFIVEKEGKAYFKDSKLSIICKPSKVISKPKYPNYYWEFDYKQKLEWFKRLVALIMVNKGNIKFIGMDADEFNHLDGKPVKIEGADLDSTQNLKKIFRS